MYDVCFCCLTFRFETFQTFSKYFFCLFIVFCNFGHQITFLFIRHTVFKITQNWSFKRKWMQQLGTVFVCQALLGSSVHTTLYLLIHTGTRTSHSCSPITIKNISMKIIQSICHPVNILHNICPALKTSSQTFHCCVGEFNFDFISYCLGFSFL